MVPLDWRRAQRVIAQQAAIEIARKMMITRPAQHQQYGSTPQATAIAVDTMPTSCAESRIYKENPRIGKPRTRSRGSITDREQEQAGNATLIAD